MARRGPLRVRALLCVRWPCTGRVRRWRRPRYVPRSMWRLMFIATSRRRSPSTLTFWSMTWRSFTTSSSVRSSLFLFLSTPALPRISLDSERPIPNRYVSATSTRLFRGRSTPAIRAIRLLLSLPLLVTRVAAQDAHHAAAADHLTVLTDLLDRCPDFHGSLLGAHRAERSRGRTAALNAAAPAAPGRAATPRRWCRSLPHLLAARAHGRRPSAARSTCRTRPGGRESGPRGRPRAERARRRSGRRRRAWRAGRDRRGTSCRTAGRCAARSSAAPAPRAARSD